MNFAAFLTKRVLGTVPLLLGISIILFAVLNLAPGGPADVYADIPGVSQEVIDNIKTQLGLDQPLPVQYVRWLGSAVRGQWGYSIRTGRPVAKDIRQRIPATLLLGGTALTLALLAAIPLGIMSALRRYSALDYTFTFLSFVGFSMPIFKPSNDASDIWSSDRAFDAALDSASRAAHAKQWIGIASYSPSFSSSIDSDTGNPQPPHFDARNAMYACADSRSSSSQTGSPGPTTLPSRTERATR